MNPDSIAEYSLIALAIIAFGAICSNITSCEVERNKAKYGCVDSVKGGE